MERRLTVVFIAYHGLFTHGGQENAYCFSEKENTNETEDMDDLIDDGNTMFGTLRRGL